MLENYQAFRGVSGRFVAFLFGFTFSEIAFVFVSRKCRENVAKLKTAKITHETNLEPYSNFINLKKKNPIV